MMKVRTFVSTLSLVLAGMMIVNVAAFSQGKGGMKRDDQRMERVLDRLSLTADQRTRIQALRDQFKQNNAAALAEIERLRTQMQELQGTGRQMNNEQRRALRDQRESLRDQIEAKWTALRPAQEQLKSQIMSILTPEQRGEMEKLQADLKEKGQNGKKGKKGKKQGRR